MVEQLKKNFMALIFMSAGQSDYSAAVHKVSYNIDTSEDKHPSDTN